MATRDEILEETFSVVEDYLSEPFTEEVLLTTHMIVNQMDADLSPSQVGGTVGALNGYTYKGIAVEKVKNNPSHWRFYESE